jgi:uncharacterized OB-fold protein
MRVVEVQAVFRHSAGKLGSHFLKTLRDEGRIVGWRSGSPARVDVPPRDLGAAGEWVDVGPNATLEAYAPNEWLEALGKPIDADSCLALIRLDGADSGFLARLRPGATKLKIGQALIARFAEDRTGSMADVWFEPVNV